MCYVDDILIFSKSVEEHLQHLEAVFDALQRHNLCIKLSKCSLLCEELEFLGHTLSKNGIKPISNKLKEILEFSVPTNVTQVRSFMGLLNYYRRFIPHCSTIATPLHRLTRKNVPFFWCTSAQQAFEELKRSINNCVELSLPDFSKPFLIYCDASKHGVGSALCQEKDDGSLAIISFFSKAFDKNQQKYHSNTQEVYALLASLQFYDKWIDGSSVTAYTDSSCVRWLLDTKRNDNKLFRWCLAIQKYDLTIKHIRGVCNTLADFISRYPEGFTNNVCSINVSAIKCDPFNDRLLTEFVKTGKAPRAMSFKQQKRLSHRAAPYTLRNGVLFNNGRIVPSPDVRNKIVSDVHIQCGHRGVCKTSNTILTNHWWPNLHRDVKEHLKGCEACCLYGQNKGGIKSVSQHISSSGVFDTMGMDITEITYKVDDKVVIDNILYNSH